MYICDNERERERGQKEGYIEAEKQRENGKREEIFEYWTGDRWR